MSENTYDRPFLLRGVFFGFVAFALALFREDPVWIGVSFFFILIVLRMSRIYQEETIKWKILKISWIPLFIGTFAPIYSPLGEIAFAAILPILGIMTLLSMIYNNSDFRTNFLFSSAFIFLFSLAGGALAGIWKFMSDRFFDTSYLLGNEYLMVDLIVVMMFGLVGVFAFIRYKNEYEFKYKDYLKTEQLKAKFRVQEKNIISPFLERLNSFFWNGKGGYLNHPSLMFHISILVLVFGNIFINDSWGFFVTLMCFVLSVISPIYSLFSKIKVSPSFHFWISGALFLYAWGESLKLHRTIGWWNPFTHVLAGMIVGSIIIIFLFYLNDISLNLDIPPRMMPLFVLIFILSIGVIWEIFEFFIDIFIGTTLQPNLQNTVYDLISNTIGAFFALLISSFLTPFEVFNELRRKNKISRWKIKFIDFLNDIPLISSGVFSGMVALSFSILRSDLIWSLISSLFLVQMIGISKVSREKKMRWNIFLWSLIPLFIGATGISSMGYFYDHIGDIALGIMIPFLSFMIIFNLIYYTRFKTNLHFTLFLIFSFSLSIGAVFGITKFFSDLYFASEYLLGIEQLMIEFLIIFISATLGTIILLRYLNRRKDSGLKTEKPFTSKSYFMSKTPKKDLISLLNSFFGKTLYYDFPWITKVLPFGIIIIIVYAAFTSNFRAMALSLPALAFSIIPFISKQGIEKTIPNTFQFWFSIILLLFLMGEILRFYPRFEWWTLVTHLVGGMVITLSIFLGLIYVDQNYDPLEIPLWMIPMLSLTTLLTIIFLEKLSLFALDVLIGTNFVGSLNYTVLDIMAALIGGGIVLQLIKLEETI